MNPHHLTCYICAAELHIYSDFDPYHNPNPPDLVGSMERAAKECGWTRVEGGWICIDTRRHQFLDDLIAGLEGVT